MNSLHVLVTLAAVFILQGCGERSEKHKSIPIPEEIPISGKIIYDSNRDFIEERVQSAFLWENGKVRKFAKDCYVPRWSPAGDRVACVAWSSNHIKILSEDGNLIDELKTDKPALLIDWIDSNTLVYAGRAELRSEDTRFYLGKISLNSHEQKYLYQTRTSGRIFEMQWHPSKEAIVVDIMGPAEEDEFTSYVGIYDWNSEQMNTPYKYATDPVLLPDGKTLLLSANRTPTGEYISQTAMSNLVEYDLETGDYRVIRAMGLSSLRLSRDEKHLFTTESSGEAEGIAVHVYALDDLEEPLYMIPTMKNSRGHSTQDFNPDGFITSSKVA